MTTTDPTPQTATDPTAAAPEPAPPRQAPYSDQAFRQAKLAMLACNTTLDLAEWMADNLLRILARLPGAFPARVDGLTVAERWVAGLPRRHYADPELTEPAGTEGER